MIRREFIRLASLTAGAAPFTGMAYFRAYRAGLPDSGNGDSGIYTESADISESSLYEMFRRPANRFRPMVRRWWNGDRVVGNEVVRELDVLQAAGIGGVEINPIRFPVEADPMNTSALTWMSDAWIDVLEVALQGTKERDMTCDMIVGSGWPYGGEFLSREDQTQMMALGTKTLIGPAKIRLSRADLLESVSPHFSSPYKDSEKELCGLTLVPFQLSTVAAAVRMDDQRSQEFIEFDVPAGDHVLYFLVKLTGSMAVINGAPGATGPVLNHYSEQAVARYLDRLSTKLSARIGSLGSHFRAFFTDSIELEGANWCDDMIEQFRKRRGYELSPWLPFVLFKVGEMGNAVSGRYGADFSPAFKAQTDLVRYDFETTKHELFQERFVGTFASWCTRNGVKSRMQVYGMELDAITAGMMIGIPECESWIWTAIIDQELWDRVQDQPKANLQAPMRRPRATEQSLLMGILYDDKDNRFTPAHTNKKGQRYRYYVSQAVIKNPGKGIAGPVRVPAQEIENLVASQLASLLQSPQKLLGLLGPTQTEQIVAASRERTNVSIEKTQTLLKSTVTRVVVREHSVQILLSKQVLRDPSSRSPPTGCSLDTQCPYHPSRAPENLAKRRSNYSGALVAVPKGPATLAMFVDGWLALSRPQGNGFQSVIGPQWRIRSAKSLYTGFGRSVEA